MSIDFSTHIERYSRGARRNFITGEELACQFFLGVGMYAPAEGELLSVLEALPEEAMAEFLRMLNIYYKAEHMPIPLIGGTGVGKSLEQQIALAKANHPRIKQARELLKPEIEVRLGIKG